MVEKRFISSSIFTRYLKAYQSHDRLAANWRYHSSSSPPRSESPELPAQPTNSSSSPTDPNSNGVPEPGPMARRLEEATEEALLTGGRAGRQAVEAAGFSDELKEKLLDKVQNASFRAQYATAFAQSAMPSSAGDGTRTIASAQAWAGEEAPADAVLRMLNDSRKPLRPELRGKYQIPQSVDMRVRREQRLTPGQRAAAARDRVATYTGLGMKDRKEMNDEQREARRKQLRDLLAPAARAIPSTLTGLAALANERIEDAIARGQFKDIPRGVGVERDARADNPFIDTTEYIMNKMIKRQEIVPPWIEKQQELVKAVNTLRSRLRNDWRRHAARMIAASGGSLQEQIDRAEEHARAEELHNPRNRKVESTSVSTNSTDDAIIGNTWEEAWKPDNLSSESASSEAQSISSRPLPPPFRDPAWEATEHAYLTLAIENLNSITRSYNLMAPDLAKKPYFLLTRELASCYADVAPQVPGTIRDRAARPKKPLAEVAGGTKATVFDRLVGDGRATIVYESKTPHYGLKEMWKDIWGKPNG